MNNEINYLPGARPYSAEQIREYTEKGYWLNMTYQDVFEKACSENLDKIFIIDKYTKLTYRQVRDKSDKLAAYLLNIGIKKYDTVILQLSNRHEFIISFLALQKIGAVPVFLLPKQDYMEIIDVMELTKPVLWIVQDKYSTHDLLPRIEKVKDKYKTLSHIMMVGEQERFPDGVHSFEECISNINRNDLHKIENIKVDPNDVALILLTGGTTGKSKAVPRTHNSMLANIRYIANDATKDDVFLLCTPIGHGMAHQGAIGGALISGGTLVISESVKPEEILKLIEKEKVTRVSFVPTQLSGILQLNTLNKYDLSSLKKIGTAGAALDSDLFIRARTFFNEIGCVVSGGAYGSSEGPSAQHKDNPAGELIKSVGLPLIDGDKWYAINEEEEILPPNQIGELVTTGPAVFTGYLHSNDENEKLFTKNGLFKTGDIGKVDENGYIFITGRKKDIIQRGGEGIIPSEIEELLRQHPEIDNAAVVAMPDPYMGERACAYVTLKNRTKKLTLQDITTFLKEKGAGVLLWPERLEIIDEFPLTNIGKLDKKALKNDILEKLKKEGAI